MHSQKNQIISNEPERSAIVMYENDNQALLATIIEPRKEKYLLLNQRGREVEMNKERFYILGKNISSELKTTDSKADYLTQVFKKAEQDLNKINLEEIWELTSDSNQELTCTQICQEYFGNIDFENHLALRLALLRDKVFFKRHKETFSRRDAEVIEELKKAENQRQRRKELQDLLINTLIARKTNPAIELPEQVKEVFRLLEDIAADCDHIDNSKFREAHDFLSLCSEKLNMQLTGSYSEKAYKFLTSIKYFNKYTNLPILHHKPPITFDKIIIEEAEKLQELELFKVKRCDLTSLNTFTIDDSSTRDMDDALSLEVTDKGYKLGIHISDVASNLQAGSLLDNEAIKRNTSLYLSDKTINMLPEKLAEDKFSLIAGKERPCISYLVEINNNLEITNTEITASIINVKSRLNYEQIDAELNNKSSNFAIIKSIAENLEKKRRSNGAAKINKRDAIVVPTGKDNLELITIDEDSPSRSLISEMMVLANELSADFFVKNKIPAIFRSQDKADPNIRIQAEQIPEGPARDFFIRVNLKKSLISVKHGLHASLGLNAYAQVTSPIRRYHDLCNQRQLLSYLASRTPFYNINQLKKIIEESETSLNKANLVSRETKRFWILLYLKENFYNKQNITGTVVRTDLKQPLVELDQVFISAMVKSSPKLKVGDVVKMKISAVDPHFDYLKLEVLM